LAEFAASRTGPRESGDDPGHLHQREANSCWMVGAATTIAVRSSDITNVTGPMRKNINRHRQAVGCRRHCWSPLPAEQHRERRGRWKDLCRCRAEVRNGRCGRKPFDSRARRSRDRCWPGAEWRLWSAERQQADNGHRIANGNRRLFSDVQQHTPRWQSPI
jgi:hypothetical protein